MPHILFVCTANICRSPVAEGILRRRFLERGLDDWSVASVGTWATVSRPPAQNSVLLMAEQGIDISEHMAKIVTAEDLAKADLILCMEKSHVEALTIEFPQEADKIRLLSEMVGRRYNIADAYGLDMYHYRQMVTEVTNLIDTGLPKILLLAEANARPGGH